MPPEGDSALFIFWGDLLRGHERLVRIPVLLFRAPFVRCGLRPDHPSPGVAVRRGEAAASSCLRTDGRGERERRAIRPSARLQPDRLHRTKLTSAPGRDILLPLGEGYCRIRDRWFQAEPKKEIPVIRAPDSIGRDELNRKNLPSRLERELPDLPPQEAEDFVQEFMGKTRPEFLDRHPALKEKPDTEMRPIMQSHFEKSVIRPARVKSVELPKPSVELLMLAHLFDGVRRGNMGPSRTGLPGGSRSRSRKRRLWSS